MNQMEMLWQLQKLDTQMDKFERKLNMYNRKEKLKRIKLRFDAQKKIMNSNKALLEEEVNKIRNNKKKADELRYNYQKTEEKLYSGIVSSAKQMEVMQKNLEDMKESIESLDNECKGREVKRKHLQEVDKHTKIKLLKYKKSFDISKKEYDEGAKETKERYDALKEKRDNLVSKIDKGLLKRYNRVKQGADIAVVCVEDDKCSGCHMELSFLSMQRLKEGNYVSCETCGRILYFKGQ